MNIFNNTATLIVTYNVMYNVSVEISHLCDQSNITIFSNLYYYPRTSACELCCRSMSLSLSKCKYLISAVHICGNPEDIVDNSVSILGYTAPAMEGTTVTFHVLLEQYWMELTHQHVWRMRNGNQLRVKFIVSVYQ